ncbi:F0F1 ATP synthase subunit epsilon [Bifidobacterium indicum]|uniref:F0F1 ATP synthase subunit epsilon n=1 Tax=Bifidobacterium indicum TaxID=1691 RepID=UPI002625C2D9|nr:F0F1 ATP synthase subunit epsilon [uncultured Bifidobacterium sp.]
MAGTAKTSMQVTIVSAAKPVWSGQARSVTVPATMGSMGIMPDHEPVLALLKEGDVSVQALDGGKQSFHVDNGFASFDTNKLTVAVVHYLGDGQDGNQG